jgi:hypothetical protein
MGFRRGRTPSIAALHHVFASLDAKAFEAALSRWIQAQLPPEVQAQIKAIALDGKQLRGIHGEELPGVRLVAGFSHERGFVLAQEIVGRRALRRAKRRARAVVRPSRCWARHHRRRSVHATRPLCAHSRRRGDYPFIVKANQPTLLQEITHLCGEPKAGANMRSARQTGQHGGRSAVRPWWASAELGVYLREEFGWTGAEQAAKVRRQVIQRGRTFQEERYVLTSLSVFGPQDTTTMLRRRAGSHGSRVP